jgi:hypothetical protein
MVSYADYDRLPPMTEARWAEFFGVPLHRVAPEAAKVDLIRRFFELVEEASA